MFEEEITAVEGTPVSVQADGMSRGKGWHKVRSIHKFAEID